MRILRRPLAIARLLRTYLLALMRDNVVVARVVLTRGTVGAAVIAVPLRTDDPWLITTFANLISLTPGTLTLDVADDRSEIYVHVLTTDAVEDIRAELVRLQDLLLAATA